MFIIVQVVTNSSLVQPLQSVGTVQSLSFSPTTFITVALYLAALTYFIGVLIYMLPLPFKGLKEWGPTLIKDAIYVTVWISIYNIVLGFAQGILSIIGASWQSYFNSLSFDLAVVGGLYLIFSFLNGGGPATLAKLLGSNATNAANATGIANVSFLNASKGALFAKGIAKALLAIINGSGIIGLLSNLFQDLFFFFLSLFILSLLIYNGAQIFMAFGILLMSIPFRIGRAIGSTFIAVSLTYYVGLPLMPAFDQLMASAIFGGTITSINFGNVFDILFHYGFGGISMIIGYFMIYYLVARVAFIVLLTSIALGLADAIGESGEMPMRIERLI